MRATLIVLMISLVYPIFSQKEGYLPPKFQNLSLKNGLSNLHVTSICQDNLGYIFIGTARGLNRYDGSSFKHYFIDSEHSTLRHNAIQYLHKTTNKKIICGTIHGINIFDPVKDRLLQVSSSHPNFNAFANCKGDTYGASLGNGIMKFDSLENAMIEIPELKRIGSINTLIGDENTGLWGKSSDNTFLFNYQFEDKIIRKYPITSGNDLYGGGAMIKKDNYIIVASRKLFHFFDIQERKFVETPVYLKKILEIQSLEITFINEVENGILWFGTKGNGLYIFDVVNNNLIHYKKYNTDGKVMSHHFSCMFRDDKQNIWLGSFDNGVEIAFEKRKNFNYDLELNSFTKNEFVNSIESDNSGTYYFGTRFNGVYTFNTLNKRKEILNPDNIFITEKNIRTLILDSHNNLWISTDRSLYIYNLLTKTCTKRNIPKPNRGIVCFCESKGRMLAGTDAQGLIVYDLNGNIHKHIKKMGSNITKILDAGNGEYIVSAYGVGKGLYRYYYKNDSVVSYNNRLNIPDNMLYEIVTCYFDSDSILWIGNFNYGLFRFDLTNDSISVFSKKDGLPSEDITGIVEDSKGQLWISTAYGLSQFDKKTEFQNYFYNEGLENIQFHQKAAHKDQYGTIFFGGNFGVTYFNPHNFGLNKKESPKVILESLRVSNVEVLPEDNTGILEKNLSYTSSIRLKHLFSVFTIEYHAFDYAAANNIKYAYMLKGFHDDWNYVDAKKYASFSNLRSGKYTFMVKAQNNNGIWSEPKSLQVEIIAPPWQTVWAFLLYFLFIISATYIVFRLIFKARIYKKDLVFEHKERLRENEISKMKFQFFTNISHEIRTPLTLIKGNVDFLESELLNKKVHVSSMGSLKRSTNRLLCLVNQILSFRKLENDVSDLSIAEADIIHVTNELLNSFRYAALARHTSIEIVSDHKTLNVYFDQDKYEKILSNLMSNALKFSKDHGKIRIFIDIVNGMQCGEYLNVKGDGRNFVEVSVCDNGKGISKALLPNIFKRFVNTESDSVDFAGTGIGLNFTKRLIDLHQGFIKVRSEENIETCFSFILPKDKEAYEQDCVIEPVLEDEYNSTSNSLLGVSSSTNKFDDKKRTILLVEDDLELNKFILTVISADYNVLTAFNGKEALSMAKSKLPDIIISDVMMPEMDGMTLCKKIREDEILSHIPVILLTAKDDSDSLISGYKYGADDYITKPFQLDVLKARISNLINLRIQLQKTYQQGVPVQFKKDVVNQFELAFMKKVEKIIHENAPKPDFNVQVLADNLFMSRTSFYRKFMSITDISPKEYLTKYRINLSIELMKKGYESFGEISFLCGFSSQSVYSVSFKKEKGITPLQYKKRSL